MLLPRLSTMYHGSWLVSRGLLSSLFWAHPSRQRRSLTRHPRTTLTDTLCQHETLLINTVVETSPQFHPNNNNHNKKKQQQQIPWQDRQALQQLWTNQEKGWKVDVEWKSTPKLLGAGTNNTSIGVYATRDIPKNQVLRTGIVGVNLLPLMDVQSVETFCGPDASNTTTEFPQRVHYLKDYLWGCYLGEVDDCGYPLVLTHTNTTTNTNTNDNDLYYYAMWIPGNGLNHHAHLVNTVYRPVWTTTTKASRKDEDEDEDEDPTTQHNKSLYGIDLVSISDIHAGDELFDDYRRHGPAPEWLRDWALRYNVSLNFQGCNDFV